MAAQVFLSYANEDRDRARALADVLRAQGRTVFWDRTIAPGMVFDEVIGDALRGAGCVVVLWSRASTVSNWVKEEADDAAQRNILVPALIDDVALPLGFRRLQAARLVGWPANHDPGEFQQFSEAIARLLQKAPPGARAEWAEDRTAGPERAASHYVRRPVPPAAPSGASRNSKVAAILAPFILAGLVLGGWSATYNRDVGFVAGVPFWIIGALLAAWVWRRTP
jgi:hypothetical protein